MGFTGCPIDEPVPPVFAIPGAPEGTWRATGQGDGFASSDYPENPWFWYYGNDYPGAPISVTLTIEDGWIVGVDIAGPDETFGFAAPVMNSAPAQIMERNAIIVDHVSGSTRTADGIIEAGEAALAAILAGYGVEVAD